MANFYAQLKQSITDFDVLYTELPSYIKHFVPARNDGEKVILFCSKVQTPKKLKSVHIKKEVDERDILDLTGSPLKDSCTFDSINESFSEIQLTNPWTDREESYQPIPVNDARNNFTQIACKFHKENTVECWALCKSDESEKIFAQSIDLNKGKANQGVLKFTGMIPYETIDISKLYAKHSLYVPMQFGPIEVMIDSFYKLIPGNTDATITLQYSQTMCGTAMETMKKMPSKFILHQTVKVDNLTSIIHKFWRQICIIDTIKQSVKDFKETKDSSTLAFDNGGDGDFDDIKKEIVELLTVPVVFNDIAIDDGNNKKVDYKNIDEVVKATIGRESTELTDQLWTVLKRCSSYEMLRDAIEYIFVSAAKINVVNMPTSQNRLAYLIREVSSHRIAIPHLVGSEPLELLIEIGIEKVRKDYEFIFDESKLCSGEDLRSDKKVFTENGTNQQLNIRKSLKTDKGAVRQTAVPARKTLMHTNDQNLIDVQNVGFQNSLFDLNTVEEHLARLGRIHLILEHIILIQSDLKLDNVYTTFLEDLNKPLLRFDVLKEIVFDVREIPISNHKILSLIENEVPDRLRAVVQSRNRFKSIRNTFLFSTEPLFPPNVFDYADDIDSKDKQYHSYQYLNIQSI